MRFRYEFQLSNIIRSLLSLDVSHMSCHRQLVESDKFEASNPRAPSKTKCPEQNYSSTPNDVTCERHVIAAFDAARGRKRGSIVTVRILYYHDTSQLRKFERLFEH